MPDRYGDPVDPPRVFTRPTINALTVRCDWCGVGVGSRCVIPGTQTPMQNTPFHHARTRAAELKATGTLTEGRMT